MTLNQSHVAGLELAMDEMHDMLDGSCESRLNRLIEQAKSAPAEPQSDGVLMPVSDVEEYISLLIDEADAHLHGRHQPEIQAHMRAEIERVRALLGGEA